jgi:hypothetical protein
MTEERKQLYREFLHRAMIDVRAHSSGPSHISRFWRWHEPSRARTLAFINALNDWLHNVAIYSAWDFKDFNEEWFWRDYAIFRKQFPADKWAIYVEGIINRLRL